MTLIYGGETWMDHLPAEEVMQKRGSNLVFAEVRIIMINFLSCYLSAALEKVRCVFLFLVPISCLIQILEGAGHNVYAGKSTAKFNEIVTQACKVTKTPLQEPETGTTHTATAPAFVLEADEPNSDSDLKLSADVNSAHPNSNEP
jgi:hypothetical protein